MSSLELKTLEPWSSVLDRDGDLQEGPGMTRARPHRGSIQATPEYATMLSLFKWLIAVANRARCVLRAQTPGIQHDMALTWYSR